MAGFLLAIMYAIPQLIAGTGFLIPQTAITSATTVQYISAVIVAVMAGLGFEYVVARLRKASEEQAGGIIQQALHR